MAVEAKAAAGSAWLAELKKELERPYTPAELARARKAVRAIRRQNAETPWPPGTVQRLLDLAEDETVDGAMPDVPDNAARAGDAASQAVAADPGFRALIAEGREAFARGEGVDAEEIFRELGIDERPAREDAAPPAKGNGAPPNGGEAPRRRQAPTRPK